MAKVTIFQADFCVRAIDESFGIDFSLDYIVEAQHTAGIAPREDDIKIRRIKVRPTGAPEGVDYMAWIRFTMAIEPVAMQIFDHDPEVQERIECCVRAAWERKDVRIISYREDESTSDETSF